MNIKVITPEKEYSLSAERGASLLGLLRSNGIGIAAVCGGKGRCGKCGIRLLSGRLDITAADRSVFSDEELENGCRLACRVSLNDDITIELIYSGEEILADPDGMPVNNGICADSDGMPEDNEKTAVPEIVFPKAGYGIAIDIGTTTLALALVDINHGRVLQCRSSENPQRVYGIDVISRIEAAAKGSDTELKRLISSKLAGEISALIREQALSNSDITRIAIAGNTAMLHILRGYDTSGLGGHPFTPVNINREELLSGDLLPIEELPDDLKRIPVTILPGISAFVGADIVSGLYSLSFQEKEKPCLFLDLGTNGEMAVGTGNKLLVTSVAAGPAFEGGNIKCGSGSIRGAISKLSLENGVTGIETIGNTLPPKGICGTGVIEITAELLKNEIIDESGLLTDRFFETGFPLAENASGETIVFTQDDIREVQLAKSAVRAGLEVLIKRFGTSYRNIEKLYISGGFGHSLDASKAARIGMIPDGLKEKCEIMGNTSLSGLISYLRDPEKGRTVFESIRKTGKELYLSSDEEFNSLFVDYMSFEG
ncbi:MAG: DUF4445 domain-containing protein [Lachnospiraceae bacterium]|nr:DUF4445 domain-containing protein [Lachnospiraceae bacterium]